jgi:ABC-type polysaccharide/polyol phosphate transport system ATPase subunit
MLSDNPKDAKKDVSLEKSSLRHAIDMVGLSKTFRRVAANAGAYSSIKSLFTTLLRKPKTTRKGRGETHALIDLTMRIPQGSSVGIVGRNGSGKSTLLKLITGIYRPSAGTVHVNGRIAALIELGAGFHPDFSGRENVFLGGVMHGLSKEQIRERFDDIVSFAELEEVIDEPVRTYSSGMFMRLGFSLAIHTDPDVLLVDEVLAVGDAGFVSKCKDRLTQMRKKGITLLLVTHDLDAVLRWCDEAIWLKDGEVADRGHPRRVIDAYRNYMELGDEEELREFNEENRIELNQEGSEESEEADTDKTERWGSREVEITGVSLDSEAEEGHFVFHTSSEVNIQISYRLHQQVSGLVFGIGINRVDGTQIFGTNTHIEELGLDSLPAEGIIKLKIKRLGLLEGRYTIDLAAHREDGYAFDYQKGALQFVVRSDKQRIGIYLPDIEWEMPSEPNISVGAVAQEGSA